ncbi:hypothetical protein [Streptomyces glomeratus]|uniref:Uncharacterized protein n=1 Tax=Streptomyces glomeratus TaxID=284452 RepID=A0ABP6M8A8_9ACTN|nr:hypothetical protein [Streptomyces glomeratus]MCF1512387.1 hypothetical protein [Streptomyces glomeratus]
MKPTSLRHRLAGTALTALVVGAGALATAPSAAAKANELTINSVSLHDANVQVQVTYSCDPGLGQELVANATTLDSDSPDGGAAAGIVKNDKLVCDYSNHIANVTLHTAYGTHFAKGDKVKVAVYYFDNDGYVSANQTTVSVL